MTFSRHSRGKENGRGARGGGLWGCCLFDGRRISFGNQSRFLLVAECPDGASTVLGILVPFSLSGEAKEPKEPAFLP